MLALLAVLLAAPPAAATGQPTCKADVLGVVEKGLAQMKPERQHAFAMRGVAEACVLPPALSKGARDMEAAPPEHRALLEARAITQAIPQWMAACPGGIETLQRMAQVAPATRALMFWKQCDVARFGLAPAALKGTSPSPLGLVLAHLVRAHDPKVAPSILKALLLAPR